MGAWEISPAYMQSLVDIISSTIGNKVTSDVAPRGTNGQEHSSKADTKSATSAENESEAYFVPLTSEEQLAGCENLMTRKYVCVTVAYRADDTSPTKAIAIRKSEKYVDILQIPWQVAPYVCSLGKITLDKLQKTIAAMKTVIGYLENPTPKSSNELFSLSQEKPTLSEQKVTIFDDPKSFLYRRFLRLEELALELDPRPAINKYFVPLTEKNSSKTVKT